MRAAWWWIDRWRTSVAYMTMPLAEQGAYRNLIDELWLRDGLLPGNERFLAMASGAGEEWSKVRAGVMAHFYETPGGWRNKTHDEVMAESKRRSEKQARWRSRSGNKGGNGGGNVTNNVTPSLSLSPDLSPDQTKNQTTAPSAPAVVKPAAEKRRTDPLVLRLKTKLGSSTNPCAAQVRALREAGWDDARISAAIETFADAGIAPWDWTKMAKAAPNPSAPPVADDYEPPSVRRKREADEAVLADFQRTLAEGKSLHPDDAARYERLMAAKEAS